MQAAAHLAADTEPWTEAVARHLFNTAALEASARDDASPEHDRMWAHLDTLRAHPALLTAVFRAAVDEVGLSQKQLFIAAGPDFMRCALQSQLVDRPNGETVFCTTWPVLGPLSRQRWWSDLATFDHLHILSGPPPADLLAAAEAVSQCSPLLGLALDADAGGAAGYAIMRGLRCGARSRGLF